MAYPFGAQVVLCLAVTHSGRCEEAILADEATYLLNMSATELKYTRRIW